MAWSKEDYEALSDPKRVFGSDYEIQARKGKTMAGRFDNVDISPNMLRQIYLWKSTFSDILNGMLDDGQINRETTVEELLVLVKSDIDSLRSRLLEKK